MRIVKQGTKQTISRRLVLNLAEVGAETQRSGILLCFLVILGVMATAVLPVLAHGGGMIHVAGEAAGAYRVTVWVAPNEVEAGKPLHFTIAVVEDESNDMILDADVDIEVLAAGETAVLSAPATTEQSVNKLFYEADFPEAPEAGVATVLVEVNGRAGSGDVSFNLDIIPAKTTINWLLVGVAALVLVTVIGFFLSRRAADDSS